MIMASDDSTPTTPSPGSNAPDPTLAQQQCPHTNFNAHAEVVRHEGKGWPALTTFHVGLRVHCTQCGMRFVFSHLPNTDGKKDGRTPDGLTAVLNIKPQA